MVSKSKLTVALLFVALSASIGLPATANATLAFVAKPDLKVWVSNDDGTEAKGVGHGLQPRVSPDGRLVAYEHAQAFYGRALMMYDVASGRRWVRLAHMHALGENVVGERTAFAWSPDSTMVAVLQNEPRSEKQTLYVTRVSGGKAKTRIATGHFRGVSFSPDSEEVVFGLARAPGELAKTDLARAPVTGGPVTFLTHDGISGWPLWGPRGQIAFSKRSKAKRWRLGGEVWASQLFDLFVMKASGGRVKRLTRAGDYETGFFPAFWFPSGERLVANFESLEKNYAAVVNPATGAVRPLNPLLRGVGSAGFAAVTLTADERTVLGCLGRVVDAIRPMASVPLTGGQPTALNEDAYSPSWSGLSSAGTSAC
jgi:dipeptidyl aminopeptidase/acylaminoacyl peptidase